MNRQLGASLVELMVAVTIGLVLTSGLYQLLNISADNAEDSSDYAQIQEAANDAINMLAYDIAQAGFMADLSQLSLLISDNISVQTSASPDCNGDGLNNGTFPAHEKVHFRLLWAKTWLSTSSINCSGMSPIVGSDILQLKRLQGPELSSASLSLDDFYLVTNFSEGVFFKGNSSVPTLDGGRYWRYLHKFYYIENGTFAGQTIPILKVRELGSSGMVESSYINGIEQIAFTFGIDSNNDGNINGYLPTSGMTTFNWDSQRVLAVTIYVVARSLEEDDSLPGGRSLQVAMYPKQTFNDGYRRFLATTTVMIENPIQRGQL